MSVLELHIQRERDRERETLDALKSIMCIFKEKEK